MINWQLDHHQIFKVFKENFLSSILRKKGYNLIQMKLRKNYQKDFHTNSLGSRGLSKLRVKDNYITVFNYINCVNVCGICFLSLIIC